MASHDEVRIRTAAVAHRVSIMTTLAGAKAAALGIAALRAKCLSVRTVQEYHGGAVLTCR
jgi:carbamoyl-phosphate synthase large subunit